MTYQTCERLAEHCRKMNDEAGEAYYLARAAKKRARHGVALKEAKPVEAKDNDKKSK